MKKFPIEFSDIKSFQAHLENNFKLELPNAFKLEENKVKDAVEVVYSDSNSCLKIVVGHVKEVSGQTFVSPNYGMIASIELLLETIEENKSKLGLVSISTPLFEDGSVEDAIKCTKKTVLVQTKSGFSTNTAHYFLKDVQKRIRSACE